jgi:hypothetical protein
MDISDVAACTLPTAERPTRLAEFDELFARVRGVTRAEPTRLSLDLEPRADVAALCADLMVREIGCCSFFTFTLVATGALEPAVRLEVTVPAGHTEVLDAMADRVPS